MIINLKSKTKLNLKFDIFSCSLTNLDKNGNEIEDETINIFEKG